MSTQLGFSTRAIHIGSEPDPSTAAVIPAISLSTTFKQSEVGIHKGYEYSRSQNPSRRAFEDTLAGLESGGASALAFASGSATSATLIQSLGAGAHVLSVNDVYGGTYRYLSAVAPAQGVEVTFLDLERATDEEILKNLKPTTKLVWVESPTNPTLRVIDIKHISSLLESSTSSSRPEQSNLPQSRPFIVVDNTFASPFYSSPLLIGADIVLHSLTKYVNGHSDVVGGALIFPARHSNTSDPSSLISRLTYLQNAIGAIPSPFDSWLAQRGAKTLAVRMKEHGLNALKLARHLESHPGVVHADGEQRGVSYPGLRSHPRQRTVWKSLNPSARKWIESLPASTLQPGADFSTKIDFSTSPEEPLPFDFPFSGMVSFRIKGGAAAAEKFLSNVHLFTLAESLGGVESLAELPAKMTHGGIPLANRLALGITDDLIRLSVGIEDIDDLIADVDRAIGLALSPASPISEKLKNQLLPESVQSGYITPSSEGDNEHC